MACGGIKMPLRSLVQDAMERIQTLQADLRRLDEEREKIQQRLQAMEILLAWERDRDRVHADVLASDDSTVLSSDDPKWAWTGTKWADTPLSVAVKQVLSQHEEWKTLARSDLAHKIVDQLIRE